MGACTFRTVAEGTTAGKAFHEAVERALYEHGHGGYTGTIAEKWEFVTIQRKPMALEDAVALADKLVDEGDKRVDDKWGPAGHIPLADGRHLFFGWASE